MTHHIHPADALLAGRKAVRCNLRGDGYLGLRDGTLVSPIKGETWPIGSACANGMLAIGLGLIPDPAHWDGSESPAMPHHLASADRRLDIYADCPVRGCDFTEDIGHSVPLVLQHLNDDHGWSTPRLASWLREVIA